MKNRTTITTARPARASVEVLIEQLSAQKSPPASLLAEARKALAERERRNAEDAATIELRTLVDARLDAAMRRKGRKNASLLNVARLREKDRLPLQLREDCVEALNRAVAQSGVTLADLPFPPAASPIPAPEAA